MPSKADIPKPFDPDRLPGWEESRRRRRMLTGQWASDLEDELATRLNASRLSNMGRLDTSVNLYRSVITQLATIYDRTPIVRQDESGDPEAAAVMADVLSDAAWWQQATRHAMYVVGLRDSAVKIDWADVGEGRIRLRLVAPDALEAKSHPDDPTHLIEVTEWRIREHPDTKEPAHFADVWSIEDEPALAILDEDGKDWTASFVESPMWVWYDEAGEPYLPWVMYHAEPAAEVFDPWPLAELVDGAFFAALLWNLWHHIMVGSSWEQRVLMDGDVRGAKPAHDGAASSSTIATAPTSVLLIRSDTDKSASIGSWAPSADPVAFANAVLLYQATMVSTLGLHASDLVRSSGTAQSGYAIQLKRSSQRRMAKQLEPQFRRGDVELLRKVALVYNAFGPGGLPVDGWTVSYQYVEDPVEERAQEHEYRRELAADGLLSRSEWYMLTNPGATKEQALSAILEAALEAEVLTRASGAMVIDDETAMMMETARERAAAALEDGGEGLPDEVRAVFEMIAATARQGEGDE